jgi:hypothetical protein
MMSESFTRELKDTGEHDYARNENRHIIHHTC